MKPIKTIIKTKTFTFFKQNVRKVFRFILNSLLVFQLSVYPAFATGSSRSDSSASRQNALNSAKKFNGQVRSLRNILFGKKPYGEYYRNHPLDAFGLLGQTHRLSLLEQERDNLSQRIKEITDQLEADPENTDLSTVDKRELRAELRSAERALKILERRVQKTKAIKLENLMIEITADMAETETVKAVLAHPSRQALAIEVLPESLKDKLNNSPVFVTSSKETNSFRLRFHDQVIQTFPQNFEWMVFFGDHLVFLEAPKVGESKALLSFIDLRYFEKAIGKTALPIFQIPLDYEASSLSPENILNPESLKVEKTTDEAVLKINVLSISESQLNFLSSLQQLNFNTTVSLLQGSTPATTKYLKAIINNYTGTLQEGEGASQQTIQQISRDTQRMVSKLLEKRGQVGSAQDLSGNYGLLNNKLNALLEDNTKTARDFKESLKQDQAFQAEVSKTYAQVAFKRSFWNRYFAFLNHITRPQPLGAPTITSSLAMIANSVSLEGDTVTGRFQKFKEALSQFLYPQKNRLAISSAVLVGAGAVATQQNTDLAFMALNSLSTWTGQFGELISVTADSGLSWVSNPYGIYEAYFKGNNFSYFLKGITALFGVTLFTLGAFHFSINTAHVLKNLRSESTEEHQNKVRQKMNQFISYMRESRTSFYEALANAEKKKLGVDASIGFYGTDTHFVFRTANNLGRFYESLNSTDPLKLKMTVQKAGVTTILDFTKQKEESSQQTEESSQQTEESSQQTEVDLENRISLKVNGSQAVFINTDPDISLKAFMDPETQKLLPDVSLSLDFEGEGLSVQGLLQTKEFSAEENKRIQSILYEIQAKKSSPETDKEALSETEIQTLSQAIGELSLGYSSWAKTFQFLGLSWNWFFIGRHIATRPVLLPKILYYSKYFQTSREGLKPSFFNGGRQNRISRTLTQIQEGFKNTKEFEKRVGEIERAFLKEVKAQTYLATVRESKDAELTALGPHLDTRELKSKRLKVFYGIYERELFEETLRAYLSQSSEGLFGSSDGVSDYQLKKEQIKAFVEDPEKLKVPDDIEQMVVKVAQEKDIAEKTRQATDHLIRGFLKRVAQSLEERAQNNLNSGRSLQIQRAEDSNRLLKDPESLARATRQQITHFMIDKTIETLYTFIFLAGVDQGILKILHDQAFTEEAWFHLGRYSIWAGFFSGLVLDVLAGMWLKTQMDSRLEQTEGFDNLPNEKEAEKGYLSWLMKQFFDKKDNSWWDNQKFAIKLAYANLLPATVNVALIWAVTLGRFDIELFLAGYMVYFVTPFMGLGFKLENAYEKSAQYAYRKLIENGLKLGGEDKKYLSHPDVQKYYMKESSKLRRRFNYGHALIYDNPIGNLIQIFSATSTALGSFSLVRIFTPGTELPTQYWSNFMDFLEGKQILSEDFAEKCKSIFTNNRPDIK